LLLTPNCSNVPRWMPHFLLNRRGAPDCRTPCSDFGRIAWKSLEFLLHFFGRNSAMNMLRTVDVPRFDLENNGALDASAGKRYGPGGAVEVLGMRPTTLSSRLDAMEIKPKRRY